MKRRKMNEDVNKLMKPVIICCLCTKRGDIVKFTPIFSTEGKAKQLHEKITNYTPFKVDEKNDLQQHICFACLLEIDHWHAFIQTCIEAQASIHRPVDTSQNTNSKITNHGTESSSIALENLCSILDVASPSSKSGSSFDKSDISDDNSYKHDKVLESNDTEFNCSHNKSNIKSKRGGGYCIARWCQNTTKTPGMSLFRIPKDKERALLWLTSAEREDLKDLNSQTLHTKYLCKEHFTDDMFMNTAKKKLVWNATPTHFCKPDYAYKDSQDISLSLPSNVVFPTQVIVFSKSQQLTRQRPIKPKPLNMDQKVLAELKKYPEMLSSERLNSEENISDSYQSGVSTETELEVTKGRSKNVVGDIKASTGSGYESTSRKKIESSAQESVGSSTNISLKNSINVNKFSELKQEKLQSVRSNSELPSNSDIAKRDENNGASSSYDKKHISENNFMNEESYLNCDAESLCLEHAYRETNEKIYPCRYCGEMFLVKSNLILHQTTYHSDRPVGCESCGRVLYKSRSEFMEHVCDHIHTDNQ